MTVAGGTGNDTAVHPGSPNDAEAAAMLPGTPSPQLWLPYTADDFVSDQLDLDASGQHGGHTAASLPDSVAGFSCSDSLFIL
jgi:hypothetical protein